VTDQDAAIDELRRGQIAGLASLVRLHQLKALRTAYGILGDAAAAEDVVSEAFVRVLDKITAFDRRRTFEPWFYRIVVNLAIDYRRKARRSETWSEPAPREPGRTTDLDARELRIDLGQQIAALPRPERAALVLRYYLDMDEESMSTVLGCPVGTVKSRLHRGRERLRRSLSDSEHDWSPTTAEGA
jgi:RNA polymerase sigma-70 factor (ECF subfamily)